MRKRKLEGTGRVEEEIGGVGGESASDGDCERGVGEFVGGGEI